MNKSPASEGQDDGEARASLEAELARAYDAAWFWQLGQRLAQGLAASHSRYLAEGAHFRAWHCLARTGLPIVVRIAKPSFLGGIISARSDWLAAMTKLSAAPPALLLPWRSIHAGESLIVISPFCPRTIAPAEHGQYQSLLRACTQKLANLDLELADHWHLRAIGSQAYIIDWSDLRRRPNKS